MFPHGLKVRTYYTMQEVQAQYGMPVVSIVTLEQVLTYLEEHAGGEMLAYADAVRTYRDQYGIAG